MGKYPVKTILNLLTAYINTNNSRKKILHVSKIKLISFHLKLLYCFFCLFVDCFTNKTSVIC